MNLCQSKLIGGKGLKHSSLILEYSSKASFLLGALSSKYSKAYLHHLFKTNEILGLRIATEHNLKFYIHLMKLIRYNIQSDSFEEWAKSFLRKYNNE